MGFFPAPSQRVVAAKSSLGFFQSQKTAWKLLRAGRSQVLLPDCLGLRILGQGWIGSQGDAGRGSGPRRAPRGSYTDQSVAVLPRASCGFVGSQAADKQRSAWDTACQSRWWFSKSTASDPAWIRGMLLLTPGPALPRVNAALSQLVMEKTSLISTSPSRNKSGELVSWKLERWDPVKRAVGMLRGCAGLLLGQGRQKCARGREKHSPAGNNGTGGEGRCYH